MYTQRQRKDWGRGDYVDIGCRTYDVRIVLKSFCLGGHLYMKTKKWLWCVLVMLCFVVFGTKSNATSAKMKALEKYRLIMAQKSSSSTFAIVYLDNDKIPELITCIRSTYMIITYKNEKFLIRSCGDAIPSYYWKKRGIFTGVYGRANFFAVYGWEETDYYKVNKEIVKRIAYIHEKNDYNNGSMAVEYFRNEKKVSKETFNLFLLKYKKGTKGRKIKFHTNSSDNRWKYLSC